MHKSITRTPVPVSIYFMTPLSMNNPLNNNVPQSGLSHNVPIKRVTNHAVPLVTYPSPQPYGASLHVLPQQHGGVLQAL